VLVQACSLNQYFGSIEDDWTSKKNQQWDDFHYSCRFVFIRGQVIPFKSPL